MSQSIPSIYLSGIGETVGGPTRREPPNNNIDSISSPYSSIMTLGKLWENIPGGNLPKILSLILFQLSIYLSGIGEIMGGCTRREPFVIKEFHISLSICQHGKMSAIHQSMSSIYLSDIGEIMGGCTRRDPLEILSSIIHSSYSIPI